jgi:glycerol kinase
VTDDILLAIDQGTSSTRTIGFSALSRFETRFESTLAAPERESQIAGWRNALRRVRSK